MRGGHPTIDLKALIFVCVNSVGRHQLRHARPQLYTDEYQILRNRLNICVRPQLMQTNFYQVELFTRCRSITWNPKLQIIEMRWILEVIYMKFHCIELNILYLILLYLTWCVSILCSSIKSLHNIWMNKNTIIWNRVI